LARNFARNVTKFAPHNVLTLIACCKLTFDERVLVRRVGKARESSLLTTRIHFIIVMIRWTGLAPWEFEFPFRGSLTSIFLMNLVCQAFYVGLNSVSRADLREYWKNLCAGGHSGEGGLWPGVAGDAPVHGGGGTTVVTLHPKP
jgi:hypothetical protein